MPCEIPNKEKNVWIYLQYNIIHPAFASVTGKSWEYWLILISKNRSRITIMRAWIHGSQTMYITINAELWQLTGHTDRTHPSVDIRCRGDSEGARSIELTTMRWEVRVVRTGRRLNTIGVEYTPKWRRGAVGWARLGAALSAHSRLDSRLLCLTYAE